MPRLNEKAFSLKNSRKIYKIHSNFTFGKKGHSAAKDSS